MIGTQEAHYELTNYPGLGPSLRVIEASGQATTIAGIGTARSNWTVYDCRRYVHAGGFTSEKRAYEDGDWVTRFYKL